MVTTYTIPFSSIAKERSNRFDVDFLGYQFLSERKSNFALENLFEIIEKAEVKVPDKFKYCEIGNVDKSGEIDPVILDRANRNELNEPLFKKIDKHDVIAPVKGDILISSVRPNLRKIVYIDDEKAEVYFTKAFIQLRPSKNGHVLYYLLRSVFFNDLISLSRQGKGYPTLKPSDLTWLRFDRQVITKLIENEKRVLPHIKKTEREIKLLRLKLREPKEIIDQSFAEEFGFDWQGAYSEDSDKTFKLQASSIAENNSNIRSGYRWQKLLRIQKVLYKDRVDVVKLGPLIQSTRNGWSPPCNETGEGIAVLGVDAIKHSGVISFDSPKYTASKRNNIDEFYISKGDLFVSRGNTLELVALAGVVEDELDQNTIFPDLFIKLTLNTDEVRSKYLAYLFNSSAGRLYFKYSAKGKNQTMVKISSYELEDFDIPLPPKPQQDRIIHKIDSQLEELEAKRNIISQKRDFIGNKIGNIIRNN